ncbi:hypothetical protein SAMN05216304_109137 [Bosea sp. OK403]|uniref:hypothetical protein n=1 Tax=Bosea sp. OK403 TaxID=1855286 RepID=UPI0008DECCAB|nr:hypothetical protein [Bosea sp. OK403]SFJ54766.1 hypothetical protein SAMN05216304_109137 [Bosea sp. OK403]
MPDVSIVARGPSSLRMKFKLGLAGPSRASIEDAVAGSGPGYLGSAETAAAIKVRAENADFTSDFNLPIPGILKTKLSEHMSIMDFATTRSIGNGSLDAAVALRKAHDEFANAGMKAARLFVPPADVGYLLDSPSVFSDVALTIEGGGYLCGPQGGGSMFKIAEPSIVPLTYAGFETRGSKIVGIAIDQLHPGTGPTNWAPIVYQPVVKIDATYGEFDLYDVFCPKVYHLLDSDLAGRIRVRNVKAQTFKHLWSSERGYDCQRIEDIHLWTYWTSDQYVQKWIQENCDAFLMKRVDAPFADRVFTYGHHSTFRFETSAYGDANHVTGGTIVADASKHVLLINSFQFTGRFGSIYGQGESYAGGGVPTVGGSVLQCNGDYTRIQIGALASERHAKWAIDVPGTGCTIDIGTAILRFPNQDNDGSGCVRVGGAASVVRFSQTPVILDGNGAKLSQTGTTVGAGVQQNVSAGAVNEIRGIAGAAGGDVGFNAIGTDANIEAFLASKGAGAISLRANGKKIFRVDDFNGNGDTNVLVRPGIGVTNVIVESAQTNADYNMTPKAAGRVFSNGSGGLVVPRIAADPTTPAPVNGQIYYNTATNQLRAYLNGAWANIIDPTLAALSPVADDMIYATGPDVFATLATTAAGRALLAVASAGQIPATVTNDNAAAGKAGEFQHQQLLQGSAVALATATAADFLSQSLTAGDWEVTLAGYFLPGATTNITQALLSLNTVATTFNNTVGFKSSWISPSSSGAVPGVALIQPSIVKARFSLASTTTIYANAYANFTVSTLATFGAMDCRRVR